MRFLPFKIAPLCEFDDRLFFSSSSPQLAWLEPATGSAVVAIAQVTSAHNAADSSVSDSHSGLPRDALRRCRLSLLRLRRRDRTASGAPAAGTGRATHAAQPLASVMFWQTVMELEVGVGSAGEGEAHHENWTEALQWQPQYVSYRGEYSEFVLFCLIDFKFKAKL